MRLFLRVFIAQLISIVFVFLKIIKCEQKPRVCQRLRITQCRFVKFSSTDTIRPHVCSVHICVYAFCSEFYLQHKSIFRNKTSLLILRDPVRKLIEQLFELARAGDVATARDILEESINVNKRITSQNLRTVLFEAAFFQQCEFVDLLLHYKADVDAYDKLHRTPLHVSAINNSFRVAKKLVAAKANLTKTDKVYPFSLR